MCLAAPRTAPAPVRKPMALSPFPQEAKGVGVDSGTLQVVVLGAPDLPMGWLELHDFLCGMTTAYVHQAHTSGCQRVRP